MHWGTWVGPESGFEVVTELPTEVGGCVWLVDLDAYARTCGLARLNQPASGAFSSRLEAMRSRRREACQRATIELIAAKLKIYPASVVLTHDSWGRPILQHPVGMNLSVSRSGNAALIGWAPRHAIGVDVELLDQREARLNGVVDHLTPMEKDELVLCGPAGARAALIAWTRKEACLKALGVGLTLAPAMLETGLTSGHRCVLLTLGGDRLLVDVWSLDVPNSAAAVAVATPDCVELSRRHLPAPTDMPPRANRLPGR